MPRSRRTRNSCLTVLCDLVRAQSGYEKRLALAATDRTAVYPVTILPGGYTPGGTAALALTCLQEIDRQYGKHLNDKNSKAN